MKVFDKLSLGLTLCSFALVQNAAIVLVLC